MEERVLRELLKPVTLNTTDYLHFGSIIQLTPLSDDKSNCLSVTPSAFKGSRQNDTINERSALTIASSKYPSQRNTFRVTHPEDDQAVRRITYNEDFLLESCCPKSVEDSSRFVIYSSNQILENPSMDVDNYYRFYYTKGNLHQPIALTRKPRVPPEHTNHLSAVARISCLWRFVHPDPEYRYEYEGHPIPASDPVLILHRATNKYLTPDWDRQRLTLLGMETCVSVNHRTIRSSDQLGKWSLGNKL